tara:strand:+ start:1068 stop:1604 length:537 start_codon:yes stop_codon:yes gene_type:complete
MIELTPLARPYAKALFASALESKNVEEISNELRTIAIASATNEVINVIESPVLSRQEVVKILFDLLDEEISEKSKKMIEILAENKRLNLLGTIYTIYQELLEEHKEQKSVEVLVAFDPSKEAEENIKHKLKSKYGDDANISFSKDPQMMGGLSIKIGDEMLDLSIKGKIKKLVNQLTF